MEVLLIVAISACIVIELLLTAPFQGPTAFTESISAAEYPACRAYGRRTSRLIPWFPGDR